MILKNDRNFVYMKYLRLFESNGIIEDLKDICLELSDMGIEVKIGRMNHVSKGIIVIGKPNKDDGECFYYKDVREVIERIKDYLGKRIHYILIGSFLAI